MEHINFQNAVDYYKETIQSNLLLKSIILITMCVILIKYSFRMINPSFKARDDVEKIITFAMKTTSVLAIFTTIGIVLSLLFETLRFFEYVPILSLIHI